ncbi:putative unusual protein kinase regulating ubiquinone biosynthesis (AarF/ABC1/UbiB family) [Marmoricola sp. OAE513]|uniref:ABC1 kinase family protein n=1 Tax=Marmoricola sp. OAE513 TaxID=2817894 RepID=UPI001AE8304D
MTELPRKAVRRTAKLAALPLGYAGRSAIGLGKRLGGKPADTVMTELQQRTAEQLFKTLGELKGGAMKFGQAMSIFEAALPEDVSAPYREQLTKLQDSAPPMPTITVRKILAEELGADFERLTHLDGDPAAAASIGQVHRARWDGRDVAVKVQYPGAGDALRSDLRQLARVARTLGPVFPGIDVKPLIAELQERAEEELDYRLEAESQRIFAAAYADDPDIAVPEVLAGTERVLVTSWLESTASLASVIRDGSEAERNHYGERFARFLFGAPARTGLLHADPHPGNFRLIPEPDGSPGKLGVLDYGAVARLPERELPRSLGTILGIACNDDYDALVDALRDEGFIRDKIQVDPDKLRSYLAPLIEPGRVEEFTFSRAWIQEQFARINDPRSDAYSVMLRLNLPPAYLLIHRTWVGAGGVLSQLGATVRLRQILTETLPGFAEA